MMFQYEEPRAWLYLILNIYAVEDYITLVFFILQPQ